MKTIVKCSLPTEHRARTGDYLMIALGMVLYGIGWTVFSCFPTILLPVAYRALHPSYILPLDFRPIYVLRHQFSVSIVCPTCVGMEVQRKDNLCRIHLTFFLSIIQKLTEGVVLPTTSLSWFVSSVPPSAVAASASPFPTTAVLAARTSLPP